jgi:hypothetical protein
VSSSAGDARASVELSLVPTTVVERLGAICGALPETTQEPAWIGMRWRVRTRTFAHVLVVDAESPPAYARVAGVDRPTVVLTFESSGPELTVLASAGHPFFKPVWRTGVVGMVLEPIDDIDWDEITELVTESYCLLAPKKLAALVDRPPE